MGRLVLKLARPNVIIITDQEGNRLELSVSDASPSATMKICFREFDSVPDEIKFQISRPESSYQNPKDR